MLSTPSNTNFLRTDISDEILRSYAKFFPKEGDKELLENTLEYGDVVVAKVHRGGFFLAQKVRDAAVQGLSMPLLDISTSLDVSEKNCNINYKNLLAFKNAVYNYVVSAPDAFSKDKFIYNGKVFGASFLLTKLIEINKIKDAGDRLKQLESWKNWAQDLLRKELITKTSNKGKDRSSFKVLLRLTQTIYDQEAEQYKLDQKSKALAEGMKKFTLKELNNRLERNLMKVSFSKPYPEGFLDKCIELGLHELTFDEYQEKIKETTSAFFTSEYRNVISNKHEYEFVRELFLLPRLIEVKIKDFEDLILKKKEVGKEIGVGSDTEKHYKGILLLLNSPSKDDIKMHLEYLYGSITEDDKVYECIANVFKARNQLILVSYYAEQAKNIVENIGNLAKVFARPQLQSFVKDAKAKLESARNVIQIELKYLKGLLDKTPNLGELNSHLKNLEHSIDTLDIAKELEILDENIGAVSQVSNSVFDCSIADDITKCKEKMDRMSIGMGMLLGDKKAFTSKELFGLWDSMAKTAHQQILHDQVIASGKTAEKALHEANLLRVTDDFFGGDFVKTDYEVQLENMVKKGKYAELELQNQALTKKIHEKEIEVKSIKQTSLKVLQKNAALESQMKKHDSFWREFSTPFAQANTEHMLRTTLDKYFKSKDMSYFEKNPKAHDLVKFTAKMSANLTKVIKSYLAYTDEWISRTKEGTGFRHGSTGLKRVENIYKALWENEKFQQNIQQHFNEALFKKINNNDEELTKELITETYKETINSQVLNRVKNHISEKYASKAYDDLERSIIGHAKYNKLGNQSQYSYKTNQLAFVKSTEAHLRIVSENNSEISDKIDSAVLNEVRESDNLTETYRTILTRT